MANLIVRIPDGLHDVARIAAAAARQSLNAWILGAVRAALLRARRADPGGPVAAALGRKKETP